MIILYAILGFFLLLMTYRWRQCEKRYASDRSKNEIDSIVFRYSSDAMLISDEKGMILSVNTAFEELTGYRGSELCNIDPNALQDGIRSREFYTLFMQSITAKSEWEGEISDCHKEGNLFYKWLSINIITDAHQQHRYMCLFHDMGKIEEVNQKLWYQANFDKLTDLPNREMFFEHLQQQLDKAKRYAHDTALLYLDLTNFEGVNEELGHHIGDKLLKEAAQRIAGCIRDVDLLYRIGGVEFTIIMPNINDVDDVTQVASSIINAIGNGFTFENSKYFNININIGIALSTDNGTTPDKMLKNADHAMYVSKKSQKNTYTFFRQSMENDMIIR